MKILLRLFGALFIIAFLYRGYFVMTKFPSDLDFSSIDFAFLGLGLLFLMVDPANLKEFELLKIGNYLELKRKVHEIERNLRKYAIVYDGRVVHSTFSEDEFVLNNYEPTQMAISFTLKSKPKYLEVRSNTSAAFEIHPTELASGATKYECDADGYSESPNNKVIVEAYLG